MFQPLYQFFQPSLCPNTLQIVVKVNEDVKVVRLQPIFSFSRKLPCHFHESTIDVVKMPVGSLLQMAKRQAIRNIDSKRKPI